MRAFRIIFYTVVVVLVLVAGATAWAIRYSAIDPVSDHPGYDAATIAHGAQLAALGDCSTCHSAAGEPAYSGGRPVPTPFGTVYSTNITPDPDTGIGKWSEAAFRRAMREGIDREGHAPLSGFPVQSLHQGDRRRHQGGLRLSHDAAAGQGGAARQPTAVPVQHPAAPGRLELVVSRSRAIPVEPLPERRLEPGRLPRRRPRPLRLVPHAEERLRCRDETSASPEPGRRDGSHRRSTTPPRPRSGGPPRWSPCTSVPGISTCTARRSAR